MHVHQTREVLKSTFSSPSNDEEEEEDSDTIMRANEACGHSHLRMICRIIKGISDNVYCQNYHQFLIEANIV